MTDTDNSETYRAEFKQAFLDWANENPDFEKVEAMPDHLEAYKDLLSMKELRSAIRELEPTNETVRKFQHFVLAQQIVGGEFEFPDHARNMIQTAFDELDAEDGWELPDHVRELEERILQDDDSPDMEP